MCIDNLGTSTRLSAPFPSYDFLQILYPNIYNALNVIDKGYKKGHYDEFKDEIEKENFIVNELVKTVKDLLKENKKNTNEKFIISNNLENFVNLQINDWCRSAYLTKYYYKENYHYVIAKEEDDSKRIEYIKNMGFVPKSEYKISPVNFANTGVVSLNMNWSNGLHQFLQIKHGLKLHSEDLTTTFLSHYSFFKRYITEKINNIYGVTGALGIEKSRDLLKQLFNADICIIPPFRPSKFILLEGISEFNSKEEWKEAIMKNIFENINRKRAILVICFTIDDANELYNTLLKKEKIDPTKIEKYDRNDSKGKLQKEIYNSGDVIFSTNLAGRGTDIKLTKEVKENRGLHVIVAFIPSNQRIEEQALGRSARSGEKGSGIIIPFENIKVNILQKIRDEKEENRIKNIIEKQIKNIELNAFLFE